MPVSVDHAPARDGGVRTRSGRYGGLDLRAPSQRQTRPPRTRKTGTPDAAERRGASRSSRAADEQGLAQQIRKRFRTAKADRQFDRTVGAREAAAEAARGPQSRAAVYEMRAGASQRKAARMQDSAKRGGFSLPFGLPAPSALASLPRGATRAVTTCVVLAITFVLVYGPASSYYVEQRQLQQLQAEYAAVLDYNEQVQEKVDYLNTDAGIEDYARSDLGWVRSGEHVVNIEGVEPTETDEDEDLLYAVPSGSVSAPDTWYSGILDVVFGYGS